jgi:hypothetical protein
MSDNAFNLQAALYTYLSANMTTPIYDAVPQKAAFPYVTIDHQEAINMDYLSERKDRRMVYFTIWSNYRGQKEVLNILTEMDGLLNQEYTIATALDDKIAQMKVMSKRTNRDADGVTYMGQLRLQVLLEH